MTLSRPTPTPGELRAVAAAATFCLLLVLARTRWQAVCIAAAGIAGAVLLIPEGRPRALGQGLVTGVLALLLAAAVLSLA